MLTRSAAALESIFTVLPVICVPRLPETLSGQHHQQWARLVHVMVIFCSVVALNLTSWTSPSASLPVSLPSSTPVDSILQMM